MNKSCYVGEYFDYKRKKLVDKLVEGRTENINK